MNCCSRKGLALLALWLGAWALFYSSHSFAESRSLWIRRGALALNGSSQILGLNCNPNLLRRSTRKLLIIRCIGPRNVRSRASTPGKIYLTARDELRISARGCWLRSVDFYPDKMKIYCEKDRAFLTPRPTNTPYFTPTVTPTVTPTPTLSANISVSPATLSLTANGSAGSFTVTNNSITLTAHSVQASLPSGFSDVAQDASGCALVLPSASCQILLTPGASAHSQDTLSIQGSDTTAASAELVVNPDPNTTLSLSLSTLALSVTGRTLDGNASGSARSIIITNTGLQSATGLSLDLPTFPTGTSASTTCGATLAPSASCSVTITPGANPSSNCGAGSVALPAVVGVEADNANSLSANVVILDYGCIYQEGYVFSMDESAPATQSIGGKVTALSDQVPSASPYIVWSSNGSGGTAGHGSFDLLPGIDQSSTSSTGSPSFTDFSNFFASTYNNMLSLSSSSFEVCAGNSDGGCNTNNIVTFYNTYRTNFDAGGSPPFTASAGPSALSDYAAGVCALYNSGSYSDWYLPAICEMGYDAGSFGSGCGTFGAPTLQNIELNLVANSLGAFTAFFYWSSTEDTLIFGQEAQHAWAQLFVVPGTPLQVSADKDIGTAGVRCVRAFTP